MKCARVCYDMVISWGDQQLVTSIVLLIAALKKLHVDKDISTYHFGLVTNLVSLTSTAFTYAAICYRVMGDWEESKDDKAPILFKKIRPTLIGRRIREGLSWTLKIVLIRILDALLLFSGWVQARLDEIPGECPAFCSQRMSMSALDVPAFGFWFASSGLFAIGANMVTYYQLAVAHKWWLPKYSLHLSGDAHITRNALPRSSQKANKRSWWERFVSLFGKCSRSLSLCISTMGFVLHSHYLYMAWGRTPYSSAKYLS